MTQSITVLPDPTASTLVRCQEAYNAGINQGPQCAQTINKVVSAVGFAASLTFLFFSHSFDSSKFEIPPNSNNQTLSLNATTETHDYILANGMWGGMLAADALTMLAFCILGCQEIKEPVVVKYPRITSLAIGTLSVGIGCAAMSTVLPVSGAYLISTGGLLMGKAAMISPSFKDFCGQVAGKGASCCTRVASVASSCWNWMRGK